MAPAFSKGGEQKGSEVEEGVEGRFHCFLIGGSAPRPATPEGLGRPLGLKLGFPALFRGAASPCGRETRHFPPKDASSYGAEPGGVASRFFGIPKQPDAQSRGRIEVGGTLRVRKKGEAHGGPGLGRGRGGLWPWGGPLLRPMSAYKRLAMQKSRPLRRRRAWG